MSASTAKQGFAFKISKLVTVGTVLLSLFTDLVRRSMVMDLSESRSKFLAILGTYREWEPHISIVYDFKNSQWLASAYPLLGKADTPEEAFRELIASTVVECKLRIQDHKDRIHFEESMIGELEGLL